MVFRFSVTAPASQPWKYREVINRAAFSWKSVWPQVHTHKHTLIRSPKPSSQRLKVTWSLGFELQKKMALLPTPFAFLQPDSGGPQLSVNGSHPLFPLAFNHSPVAFHHPESTLFDEEQQQTQLRQLQQLRQAQLKMDGLQAQTFPSSTNFMDRKRNRNTDRRQQRLNHELDQDFSLASLPSTHPDDFVTGSDSDGSSDQSQAGRPDASSVLGPIAALDGNAPVVPVLSLPIMRNGTLIQLPVSELTSSLSVLWTGLADLYPGWKHKSLISLNECRHHWYTEKHLAVASDTVM